MFELAVAVIHQHVVDCNGMNHKHEQMECRHDKRVLLARGHSRVASTHRRQLLATNCAMACNMKCQLSGTCMQRQTLASLKQ